MDDLWGEMRLLDEEAKHDGYWYSVSGVLTILVCGMLCGLRLIDDIDDWAKAAPTRLCQKQKSGNKCDTITR